MGSAEEIDLRNALARLNPSDRELLALKYLFHVGLQEARWGHGLQQGALAACFAEPPLRQR